MKAFQILNIFILVNCTCVFGQPNFLDTSLNHIGLATYPFYTNNDECHAIIIQPDKKIVMAGVSYMNSGNNSPVAICRCNINGSPDGSFGTNGLSIFQAAPGWNCINALALQEDGKIVATGTIQDTTNLVSFLTLRFNTDGSIDNTFSNDGFDIISFLNINDQSFAVKVQHDGKILVAGYSSGGCGIGTYVAMARYNTDGSMDNSFGNSGKVLFQVNGSSFAKDLILKDDYIYITGLAIYNYTSSAFLLARFSMDGQIDNTFGTNGTVITPIGIQKSYAYSINSQSNGKLICGGVYGDYINNDSLLYALVRYNADGSIDNTFGNNGILITTIGGELIEAFPLAIQPDDKIVIGCTSGFNYDFDFVVARFLPDGDIDSTFGNNGAIFTDFGKNYNRCYSIAIQADGKIDAAGMAKTPGFINIYDELHFALARYLPELQLGIINNSSGNNILYVYPNPILIETTLEYELTNDQEINISVFDLSGKLIKPLFVNKNVKKGVNKELLNLSGLQTGTYILKIFSKDENISIQIIKE
jgi:uncharacterized delta-60 repeat protein